jgi:glycopeptide antibiotics resistance protein
VSTLQSPTSPSGLVLTRRHHGWLALGLALFIVYGSLVPFHYIPLSWGEALDRFRIVCGKPIRINSRSDWLANFVLVLPLGYLLMGMLCSDRPKVAGLAVLAVLPCCFCLSAAVEFTQLWFPPRVSSVNDIVAQTMGAMLGILIWLTAGQRLTNWVRSAWRDAEEGILAARLLPGYLILLLLITCLPFDLALSPAELYHKYRDGHFLLVPFIAHGRDLFQALARDFWNVAMFLPLGLLLERLPALGRRGWRSVLAVSVTVAVLIQGVKLVVSQELDATDVVTGSLTVLAGWGLARTLRDRRIAAGLSGQVRDGSAARRQPRLLVGLLLLVWLAAAVFVNWQPFHFNLDVGLAASRLQRVSLIPFADYYAGNYWTSLDQFVHKVLLFIPFGVLFALVLPSTSRNRAGLLVLLAAALVAAGIEAGQLFLLMRSSSLTDILVESGGAWIGLAMTRHAGALTPATTRASDRTYRNQCSYFHAERDEASSHNLH